MNTNSVSHLAQLPTEMTVQFGSLALIASAMKRQQPEDREFHRALDRALDHCDEGRAFTLRGDVLEVESASKAGMTHDTTLTCCTCEAGDRGLMCWHRALLSLVLVEQTLQAATFVLAATTVPATPKAKAPRRERTLQPRVDFQPARRPMSDEEYAKLQAECDDFFGAPARPVRRERRVEAW